MSRSAMIRMGQSPTAPALHCLCWGDFDSKKSGLILVHGFNQSAHSFDEVAPRLSLKNNVVCVDQRGHGLSNRCVNADGYSASEMASDIGRVADYFFGRDKFSLVGMSMGAVHAIRFAAAHGPDRLHKLVIVDNAPTVNEIGVGKIAVLTSMNWPTFDHALDSICAFNPNRSRQNVRSRLEHTLALDESTGLWTWRVDPLLIESRFLSDARLHEPDSVQWNRLRQIQCPTLLVRGEQSDILSKETAEQVISCLPNGVLKEVAGAGHSVAGDNPSGFLEAVEPFLHRQDPKM